MRKIGLLKKVVSITGIMTLFLVSGCGAKQEEPESVLPVDGTDEAAQEEQDGQGNIGKEMESGDVTIHFAEHVANIEAQEPHMMKIIQAFEETYPNIHIDITGKEVSEHNTQMTLLAGEDNLPDIFWLQRNLLSTDIFMI